MKLENEETLRLKEFINTTKITENKFNDDVLNILEDNKDYLLNIYYRNEDIIETFDVILNIFFYEKIHAYQRTEAVKIGLLNGFTDLLKGIKYDSNYKLDTSDFEENICRKIKLYIDKFSIPEYTEEYAGKKLFDEVMSLNDSHIYKKKLWHALLYPLFENLNDFEKQQMIDNVLVDYDFKVKIPEEEQRLKDEWFRVSNYIQKALVLAVLLQLHGNF